MLPRLKFAALLPLIMLAACTTTATTAPRTDDLAASNTELRGFFNEARRKVLASETFVLVGGDELYFYRNGKREVARYTPQEYHDLKAVAHVSLAMYGLFVTLGEGPYDESALGRIAAYRTKVEAAHKQVQQHGYTNDNPDGRLRQSALFATALDVLTKAHNERKFTRTELDAWCASQTEPLMQNAYEASLAQLEGLNREMTRWMDSLTPAERSSFHAVVSGSHQAREDNLQMAYFRALFDEPGPVEERLVFAESVFDERGLWNMMGTHILDGNASRAFFGDDKRLQRDLLGDAAREIVGKLKLPR